MESKDKGHEPFFPAKKPPLYDWALVSEES